MLSIKCLYKTKLVVYLEEKVRIEADSDRRAHSLDIYPLCPIQ